MSKTNIMIRTAMAGLLLTFTLSGAMCAGKSTAPEKACPGGPCSVPINLTVWRLFDDREVLDPAIKAYTQKYKNVTVTYKKMDPADYEETLINALSAGTGPDIFQIHNDWVPKHGDKIAPVPADIMKIEDYQNTFVPVAAEDFIANDNIYAMPYSVDTLALYYNPNILSAKKLFSPPATWDQLKLYSQNITEKTGRGNITLSGITLGTAKNITRASDILYAMMLQNGAVMTSPDNTSATFANYIKDAAGNPFVPGLKSLEYYTSFANPNDPNFCWNVTLLGSEEAFEKGLAAMTINYAYRKADFEKFKDPKVKIEIATLPQVNTTDDPVSYANYWGETVNKQSANVAWSWDFIKFVATKQANTYRQRSGKPTALKEKAKGGDNAFEKQSLYARSFYKIRATEIDNIFNQMIDDVSVNQQSPQKAIDKAQSDVTKLMQKYREQT